MKNTIQKLSFLQNKEQVISFCLLLLLTLIWGLNWPILKTSLKDIAPLWLGAVRLGISSLLLLVFILATKKFKLPNRQDIPIICSVTLLQMTAYMALVSLGLNEVSASRSAILTYTTPIWVAPLAIFLLKEKLSILKLTGLLVSIFGIVILFSPFELNWKNHAVIYGNLFLILAAVAWAISMIHTRSMRWHLSPLQLLPWQLFISSGLLWLLALIFEPHATIHFNKEFMWTIAYICILSTAVGYWLIIELSRRLPSIITSMGLLITPVLGIITSHLFLGDVIDHSMIVAMILIMVGLVLVLSANKRNKTVPSKMETQRTETAL